MTEEHLQELALAHHRLATAVALTRRGQLADAVPMMRTAMDAISMLDPSMPARIDRVTTDLMHDRH